MVVPGESVYYCGEEACPLDWPNNSVLCDPYSRTAAAHKLWIQKISEHFNKNTVRANVFVPNEAWDSINDMQDFAQDNSSQHLSIQSFAWINYAHT